MKLAASVNAGVRDAGWGAMLQEDDWFGNQGKCANLRDMQLEVFVEPSKQSLGNCPKHFCVLSGVSSDTASHAIGRILVHLFQSSWLFTSELQGCLNQKCCDRRLCISL